MKSGKKSVLAKTMRVATTFTGAAACAAAFAPAATAATHPTAVEHAKHELLPTPRATLPTAKGALFDAVTPDNSGSIRTAVCSGRPNWFHFVWFSVGGAGPFLTCAGFKGTIDTSLFMSAQCGGNNIGYIDGPAGKITYGPGTTYRVFSPSPLINQIHISRWTGGDAC
jgi:hypothetical protein